MIEILLSTIPMTIVTYLFVILFFFWPGWLISRYFAKDWHILFRMIWIVLLLAPGLFITPGGEAGFITPVLVITAYYWSDFGFFLTWNFGSIFVTGVIAVAVALFLEKRNLQSGEPRRAADKIESALRLSLAGLVFLSLWWPLFERGITDYRPSWVLVPFRIFSFWEAPPAYLFVWLFPLLIPVNVALALRSSDHWIRWLQPASRVLLIVLLPLSLYLAFGTTPKYLEMHLSDNGSRMLVSVVIIAFGCLSEIALTAKARRIPKPSI